MATHTDSKCENKEDVLSPEQKKRIEEQELMEKMFVRHRFRDEMTEGVAKREYNLSYYELVDGIKAQQLHFGHKRGYSGTCRYFSEKEVKKYAYSLHPEQEYKIEKKKINREIRALNKSIKQIKEQMNKLDQELIQKVDRKMIVQQSLKDLNEKHNITAPKPKSKRNNKNTRKRKSDIEEIEDSGYLQPPNKRQRSNLAVTSMPPPLI